MHDQDDSLTSTLDNKNAQDCLNFLAASGLTPADVRGWRYVDPFTLNMLLGFDSDKRVQSDGIAISYCGLDGDQEVDQGMPFHRVRLLQVKKRTDGKDGAKYLSPNGAEVHVYIPENTRLSIRAGTIDTLVITEGEKKAELLAKLGIDAVALPGISMGRVRQNPDNKDEPRLLVGAVVRLIEAAKEKGLRSCVILFDAEGKPLQLKEGEKGPEKFVELDKKRNIWVRNSNVYYEAVLLARDLRDRFVGLACSPMWASIPEGWANVAGKDPYKAGVDDWALAVGEQATRQAIAEVSARAKRTTEEEKVEREKRKAAMEVEGYFPLGMESGKGGDPVVVLWSNRNGKMVRLGSTEMSKQATWLSVFGPTFACEHWPKLNKDGAMTSIDLLAAQREVISACQSKNEWSSSRERGGGVWAEGDVLFINAKEGLFYCDQNEGFCILSESDRHSGRNIYPRTGNFSIGVNPDRITPEFLDVIRDPDRQKSDIDMLIYHFKQWGGMSEFQSAPAMMLAGWIAAQSFLGALTARPSMMVSGESGSGKSLLAEHITEVLGKTAIRIDDGASATEPGIRQKLGKDAQTLLLDEAEPGSSNAAVSLQRSGNLRRILNLLRASYSTTDSENTNSVASLKGSSDGRAVDYSLRTAAILFAIGKPDLEQADLNRTVIADLRKEGRSKNKPTDKGLHELGARIRFAMWTHWTDFLAMLAHIHHLCAEPAYKLNVEARLANTWGVPIAAMMCFAQLAVKRVTDPESLSQDAIEQVDAEIVMILSNVRDMQNAMSPAQEKGSDAEQALSCLLSARIRIDLTENNGEGDVTSTTHKSVECSVRDALEYARAEVLRDDKSFTTAIALRGYGLRYYRKKQTTGIEPNGEYKSVDEGFLVSDCVALRKSLSGTQYSTQNIETVLSRLNGSERTRQRFKQQPEKPGKNSRHAIADSRIYCTWIPHRFSDSFADETGDFEFFASNDKSGTGVQPDAVQSKSAKNL